MIDQESNYGGYITNVIGGAFMPDMNQFGQVAYSHYEKGASVKQIYLIQFVNIH